MHGRVQMTNQDIVNYQAARKAFSETNLGKLWFNYTSRQQRAERYDAQMEYTDSGSNKKLTLYWDEARAAEQMLLEELYKLENLEYVKL